MVTKKVRLKAVGAEQGSATEEAPDTYEAQRHARFGNLPAPVRLDETVEERPAGAPDPRRDAYDDDEWLVRYGL